MGFTTCTISVYIQSKSTLLEKINAIDDLITAMEGKLLEGIDTATIDEYWMDDGQMKVKTIYRSVADLEKGLEALLKMKQRYVNNYNGRMMVMRDASGLNR